MPWIDGEKLEDCPECGKALSQAEYDFQFCNSCRASRVMCKWWAACGEPATTTRPHPILGDVPICARCQAAIAAMD